MAASGRVEEWRLKGEDADEHFGVVAGGGLEVVAVGEGAHGEIFGEDVGDDALELFAAGHFDEAAEEFGA